MAGAPVLSKNKDRIVGAIYVGAETGPGLVERLKKNLDVDVALLLRGKVIASSRPAGELDALPEMVTSTSPRSRSSSARRALPLTVGQDKLLAVAAPFPGQAGEQQAYYALLGDAAGQERPRGAARPTSAPTISSGGTSPGSRWSLVTFAMIAVGLILQRVEVEAPLGRLRRELQKLAAGDIHKIDDHKYRAKFGGLARDVNAAVERFTHAPGARSEMAGKDLNAILGPSGGSTFDLPVDRLGLLGLAAGAGLCAAARAGVPAPRGAGVHRPPSRPRPRRRLRAAAAAVVQRPARAVVLGAVAAAAVLGRGLGGSSSALAPLIKSAPWAQRCPPTRSTTRTDCRRRSPDARRRGDARRPLRLQEEEDAHFRHVFDDFVETKRSCGEPTAGLTQAKFLQKLRDNKSALVAKHGCRTVRFSVYVKDGKAALRATPIRE